MCSLPSPSSSPAPPSFPSLSSSHPPQASREPQTSSQDPQMSLQSYTVCTECLLCRMGPLSCLPETAGWFDLHSVQVPDTNFPQDPHSEAVSDGLTRTSAFRYFTTILSTEPGGPRSLCAIVVFWTVEMIFIISLSRILLIVYWLLALLMTSTDHVLPGRSGDRVGESMSTHGKSLDRFAPPCGVKTIWSEMTNG